jgi:hypothetical protein
MTTQRWSCPTCSATLEANAVAVGHRCTDGRLTDWQVIDPQSTKEEM